MKNDTVRLDIDREATSLEKAVISKSKVFILKNVDYQQLILALLILIMKREIRPHLLGKISVDTSLLNFTMLEKNKLNF